MLEEPSSVEAGLALSIVVPFFDEECNIRRLHAAVVEAVSPLGISYEMVFVDDGSLDRTFEIAVDIARRDPHVTVIGLRRNVGQTAAMVAGIAHARGEIIVTMDGDLQNDPRDIERLLCKMTEGYDVVAGWRHDRQDPLLTRRIPAQIANWLIGKVMGLPLKDSGCSLKAYRRSLITGVPLYSDMHRFTPAVVRVAGSRVAEVKVRHHPRVSGRSKYGLSRTYKVLLDVLSIKTIVGFVERPLVWFSMLAAPLALLGTTEIVFSLWRWGVVGGGFPLPLAGSGLIFIAGSVILALGGAVCELSYRLGDSRTKQFWQLTARIRDAEGQSVTLGIMARG